MNKEALEYYKSQIPELRRWYKEDYRPMAEYRLLKKCEIHYNDVRRFVMMNDTELFGTVLSWSAGYKLVLARLSIDFPEELDFLIELAIECESHECYLMLVDYKYKHGLYQDNPFEL